MHTFYQEEPPTVRNKAWGTFDFSIFQLIRNVVALITNQSIYVRILDDIF